MNHSRRPVRRLARTLGMAVVCLVSVHCTGQGESAPPAARGPGPGGAAALDQGWRPDTAAWWHHVSQGTVFMPFEWFVALEQAQGDALFAATDHLERLGFLADRAGPHNPRGLPVGFTSRPLDIPARPPYQYWKGEWVGFACAACHTGQLRHRGQQIRLEGGPSHLDIETFGDALAAALAATATSEAKFTRFAGRVLRSGAQTTPQALRESFTKFVQDQLARRSLFEGAQGAAAEEPTVAGLGRLDAVHRGGNLLLAAPLAEPRNYLPTTAPVSFPALWDTPHMDWVLYNASIRQPLARNVIEALGVGAPVDPRTFLSDRIDHALPMDNIVAIHRSLVELRSPRWPEAILGPIDTAKAARGEAIYRQACAGCHAVIDRRTHRPVGAAARDSVHPITVTVVPLEEIGTDPRQARNFAARVVSLEKIGGPARIAYKDAAQAVSGGVVDQWKAASPANAETERAVNQGIVNEFRGLLAYRARPLNGAWATAPYLHNGSVPSLHDLLLPPAQRPRIFYVGSWEFDPIAVGVESGSPFPGAFTFDTRLPGNSNAGHTYGTDLPEADRMALIEYLKTL